MLSNPGMWAVLGYRFCRWVYVLQAPWLIQKPLNLATGFVAVFVQVTTNVTLPARARIGPGLYIPIPATSSSTPEPSLAPTAHWHKV